MADLDRDIWTDEESALERILGFIPRGAENDRCRELLSVLHQQGRTKETKALSQTELAVYLGMKVDRDHKETSTQNVRLSIEKLRNELLPRYYDENPWEKLRFEIPRNNKQASGYQLNISHRGNVVKNEEVKLFFDGRENTREWFRNTICESSDVLFVSVGMQHALDMIFPWFRDGHVSAKHFRVLTWRPKNDSMDVVAAFTSHTEEDPQRFLQKQRNAWQDWKRMEEEYPFVEVYGYESTPSMQGVCNADQSLTVELFPFQRANTKHGFHSCGTTGHRPMLFAEASKSPHTFWLFKHSFEDLWFDSLQRARHDDIHERWREPRRTLCLERGLTPE